eukprot:scaffold2816_cov105-Isochrysis_galbana.AAC.3
MEPSSTILSVGTTLNCRTIISVAIIHSCVHHHVQAAPTMLHPSTQGIVTCGWTGVQNNKTNAPQSWFCFDPGRQFGTETAETSWPSARFPLVAPHPESRTGAPARTCPHCSHPDAGMPSDDRQRVGPVLAAAGRDAQALA